MNKAPKATVRTQMPGGHSFSALSCRKCTTKYPTTKQITKKNEKESIYQAMLHGHKVRLNVATERRVTKKGQVRIRYYLYSINDIKE